MGKKKNPFTQLKNLSEKVLKCFSQIKENKNRKKNISKLEDYYSTIKNILSNENLSAYESYINEALNFINFMKMGQDQFEDAFIEDMEKNMELLKSLDEDSINETKSKKQDDIIIDLGEDDPAHKEEPHEEKKESENKDKTDAETDNSDKNKSSDKIEKSESEQDKTAPDSDNKNEKETQSLEDAMIVVIKRTPIVPEELDSETIDFLKSFVVEAYDLLDEAEGSIEFLSYDSNKEHVDKIFRLFHSLKGLAGFLNLEVVKAVAHEAETLLDIFRLEEKGQSDESIDLIYKVADFLRELVNTVDAKLTDEEWREEAVLIVQSIRKKIYELKKGEPEPEPEKVEISEDDFDFFITKEMIEKYIGEAAEMITNTEKDLLELENDIDNAELLSNVFGNIHSLKGNSGFLGFSDIEEVLMDVETILDDVRNSRSILNSDIISAILSVLDTIKNSITTADLSKEKVIVEIPEKEKILSNLTDIQAKFGEYKPLGEILVEMGAAKSDQVEKALSLQNRSKAKSVSDTKYDSGTAASAAPSITAQKKDIRVNTEKLDKLFDLVGELMTAEVMVTNNPDLQELDLPNFSKASGMLSKITKELQDITMSIRMMPLEGLFNKMKRLVRDLARKSGKKINFTISGEDTEMDKNVIEQISDPLVHILRNAIDHGIEPKHKRKAAGKSEEGLVKLEAMYEGNEILISITDDGKGLSKEKILNKAIEKGVCKQNPEELTDEEIYKFIFEPGFSTAEKVSEISGRGVGMDVVRRNIEKLGGMISLDSSPGEGSQFILRIPLTLAIMDGMLVRVGDSRYSIPIDAITESFRPDPESITVTMDGQEIVRVRDDLIPVIRLHELFRKEPDSENLTEGILILLASHKKKICLFIDEILGQQQTVVKGFSDYIGKINGVTGCMILSDGEVGLILDVAYLISLSDES